MKVGKGELEVLREGVKALGKAHSTSGLSQDFIERFRQKILRQFFPKESVERGIAGGVREDFKVSSDFSNPETEVHDFFRTVDSTGELGLNPDYHSSNSSGKSASQDNILKTLTNEETIQFLPGSGSTDDAACLKSCPEPADEDEIFDRCDSKSLQLGCGCDKNSKKLNGNPNFKDSKEQVYIRCTDLLGSRFSLSEDFPTRGGPWKPKVSEWKRCDYGSVNRMEIGPLFDKDTPDNFLPKKTDGLPGANSASRKKCFF